MTHTRALWQCRNRYILSLYPPSVNSAAPKPQRQVPAPRPPWLPAAAQHFESLLCRHLPKAHSRLREKNKPTFAHAPLHTAKPLFFRKGIPQTFACPSLNVGICTGKLKRRQKRRRTLPLFFAANRPYAVVLCALVWRNVAKNAARLRFWVQKAGGYRPFPTCKEYRSRLFLTQKRGLIQSPCYVCLFSLRTWL